MSAEEDGNNSWLMKKDKLEFTILMTHQNHSVNLELFSSMRVETLDIIDWWCRVKNTAVMYVSSKAFLPRGNGKTENVYIKEKQNQRQQKIPENFVPVALPVGTSEMAEGMALSSYPEMDISNVPLSVVLFCPSLMTRVNGG